MPSSSRRDGGSRGRKGGRTMNSDGVVDGLRITIPGDELRRLLDERIAQHERSAAHWKRELIRSADEQTDDEAQQPDEMCANEAIRHEWRVDVLAFIREHVEPHQTYRIGERDLIFAELLPAKPWFVEQEEYEERTGVGTGR